MKCVKGESCLHCGSNYCRFVDELDQLKVENEKLKKNLNEGCLQHLTLMTEQQVLLKTITEIKEIAEENIRIADLEGLNGVYRRGLAEQILQKISECEANQ